MFARSCPSATDYVRRPAVGQLAVGEHRRRTHPVVRFVEISRHAVCIVEAVDAIRLQESYAAVPLVRERVAQRRRDALVQIAVGVRIGVRHDGRVDRREAVGLFARYGDVEGGAAVLIERTVHAELLTLRVIAAVLGFEVEARRMVTALFRKDLHDPADRTRTVQRRHIAVDHFDVVDLIERHLRELRGAESRRLDAHAVDQHERLRRRRAAQEHPRRRARPAVARDLHAGREREEAE